VQAAEDLRGRLEHPATARDLAKAGAEFFRDLLQARTVSISTLEQGQYRELVNVGYLPSPNVWYPATSSYSEELFPIATRSLEEHGGYFTADFQDPKFDEFVGSKADPDVASIMGIAMVTAGSLQGEIFLTRGQHQRPFDREDLDLARDLATTFGLALERFVNGPKLA
jgi:GAF domain-containing protein